MSFIDITESQKDLFNQRVSHPLQSFEWGRFREKGGIKVIRECIKKDGMLTNCFQMTIHKIPHSKLTIGYLPKGFLPDATLITRLKDIGKKENCIFIQLEPNVAKDKGEKIMEQLIKNINLSLTKSFNPLFTRYTFVIDLKKSEEELLSSMHSKTRYNIKVAKKHEIRIEEDPSSNAFEEYLKLTAQTTIRQKFFAHNEAYHRLMWNTLRDTKEKDGLKAHLLTAVYKDKNGNKLTLAAWILFVFGQKLYYPYGSSSNLHRETMASNLLMWETIRFGKRLGLKEFDLWGSLGQNPNIHDPWYGFHKFKQGYAGKLEEFVGSYDLIINKNSYILYKIANSLRWFFLRLEKNLKVIEHKA